jgi:TPR repeat protein
MRLKKTSLLLLSPLFATLASAAISTPLEVSPEIAKETTSQKVPDAEGPAKAALEAFRAGDHEKAVALATPLAASGNPEALYLLGFAAESGKGAEVSRDKAIEYYTKASAAGQKDAIYRLAFILLASEKEEERAKAQELLQGAMKDDPAVAGRILGEGWMRGRFSKEPDFDKTVEAWSIAAAKNDAPSVMLLARLYEGQFGFADKKDAKKALGYYKKAAELGEPAAMTSLASRLLNGEESLRNEAEGREWLKKAIEAKDYSAYLVLGDFEENGKKDLKAALAAYEKGKDAEQVDCMIRAAGFYIEGKGAEKDVERGNRLLETAAKAGSADAHLRLAINAFAGEKPDVSKGYGHLVNAAGGGIVEAQNELGLLYLSGKMGGADASAAAAWFTRAAQAGYAASQNNLATLFERGAGVQQNFQNAGQLYALAAQQGHPQATLALARLHIHGAGTKRDLPKAWALATAAGERGEKEAATVIKELEEIMTADQVVAGKKQLEEMKSSPAPSAAPKADPEAKPAPKK